MRRQVVSGALAVGLGQLSRIAVTLGTVYVLAHILEPSDFGIVAIVISIALIANLVGDFGLGAVAVQREEVTDVDLSTIFWFNVVVSIALALVLIFAAGTIADLLREPTLAQPLQASSLVFPCTSIRVVHRAILDRRLDFNRIAIADTTGTITGSLVAIILAWLGAGIWSLIVQQILFAAGSSASYILFTRWRPRLEFSVATCRSFLSFGAGLTASNALPLLGQTLNRSIMSADLGITSLGYYSFAFQLISYPLRNISAVLQRMAFPVLARVQDDLGRQRNIHLSLLHLIGLLLSPILSVTACGGAPLFALVFGNKWMPIAEFFYIMGLAAVVDTIRSGIGVAFLARGRTNTLVALESINAILGTIAVVVGVRFGLPAVCLLSLAGVLVTLVVSIVLLVRSLDYKLAAILGVFFPVLLSNLCLCGVFVASASMFPANSWLDLGARAILALTAYMVAELALDRRRLAFLLRSLWDIFPRARGAAGS